jgi:hypothetical protein
MGAWGAIHTQPWTRRMPMTAAERKSRAKFSVGDFGRSSCEPTDMLREPCTREELHAGIFARVSLSDVQSLLLRAPERG